MTNPPDTLASALSERYRVIREIGRGGMATVYLAEDLKHQRPIALKVLRPELSPMLGAARFQREIQIAARLQHPNILPFIDSGDAAGQLWYAMPYVEGDSLRARLDREVQLPIEDTLQIAHDVAAALDHAHKNGVIHRDIKPENILLHGGRATVADFGIARAIGEIGAERLTETGLAIGTPIYMSPEQISGGLLDGRSDLYALAVVLYEMLAGTPPFTGPTAQAVWARHAFDPVPALRTVRSTVTPSVEAAITRALAKAPADRFTSVSDFVAALNQTVPARVDSVTRPRTRVLSVSIAAFVVVAAGAWAVQRFYDPSVVDANRLVVAPFRVNAADATLGYLREGMMDLLNASFTGEGGPSAVEARSVVGVWSRAEAQSAGGQLSERDAIRLTTRLGAAGLVLGSLVSDGRQLNLEARLIDARTNRERGRAVAKGHPDSLWLLVDQLTSQLLGVGAGIERRRLSQLTSTSLPAVRAYLEGQSAFRKGRFDYAQRAYRVALDIDSTFALAALALASSVATDGDSRGVRLAYTFRTRLSPADRALAEARAGPAYPFPSSRLQVVSAWEAAARENPDRAEVWFGLGDVYYHSGLGMGMADALARADTAFRRGASIDSLAENRYSPHAPEAIDHMMELAVMNSDVARARTLLTIAVAADTTAELTYLNWLHALVVGDSAVIRLNRVRREALSRGEIDGLMTFSQWNGAAVVDVENVLRYWVQRDPAYNDHLRAVLLNGGRPFEAMKHERSPLDSREFAQTRISDALFWDGDTVAAWNAATRLERFADAPDTAPGALAAKYYLELWRLSIGQTSTAEAAVARLRSPDFTGMAPTTERTARRIAEYFASQLEAMLQVESRHANALRTLNELDSIAKERIPDHGNLIIAGLYERAGDRQRALRAVRRRGSIFGLGPRQLSTYLREEGRLAAQTGDKAGAIRAYRHYLALRWNPEPHLIAEVSRVRGELERLLAESR